MRCAGCQETFPPGARFCPGCGAPRPRYCTECGAPALPQAKFCAECGTRLSGERPAGGTARDSAAAQHGRELAATAGAETREVAPELRTKIESVRSELRGERREVAVIFADLSGFTALSERMDAEETSLLVNRLMTELAEAVTRFEGHVDKFIGDAIMALFGAPVAHEDDPERAVLAALAMLDVVARHNAAANIPLPLRVGINLGEVVATHLGSSPGLNYTVLGDTVNVASRLEGAAAPNTVLVSEAVFRRLSSRFRAEKLSPLTLKGKSEPVQVYRISGFEAGERLASRLLAPFVGRSGELGALDDFLARLERGRGGALLIDGEPGSGKSRLAREALARWGADAHTIEVAFSAIQLPGQRSPRSVMFEQLLPEEPHGASAAERALALLGDAAEAHRAGIDGLAAAAHASGAPERDGEQDPAVARQNRWLALAALLRAAAESRPVLLFIEDLHWIDEATQEFLEMVWPRLSGGRVGLLLTSRPRPEGAWLPASAERLVLGPLERRAAEALLDTLVQRLEATDRRELIRRSGGNPLFLEELGRALSQGAQVGPGLAGVPSTLQGLLVSRIDRLGPPVRRLLEMAAVLGTRFPTRLLDRMYALEPQALEFDRALHALEAAGFLEPEMNGEDWRRFHHALVQEAAYNGLLVRIRKVLHEAAARLGEQYYAGRLEAEAGFFAHHYWEAGLLEEAAPHLWVTGRSAAERYELSAAERLLGRVAEAIDKSPRVLARSDERALFDETLGTVLLHRGKLDAAEDRFRRLESVGASEGRSEWQARGLEHRGRTAWYRGQLEDARALFERALEILASDDGRLAADLHNDLGVVFYYRGMPEEAFSHHGRALRLREEAGDRHGTAKSFLNIGNLFMHFRDDLDGAERHYQQGRELARAVGDRQLASMAINNLGGVALQRGDWDPALSLFREAQRLQEETGWSFMIYVSLRNQVECEIALGRLADAFEHLRTCIEEGDAFLEPVNRVNVRLFLVDALLRALLDERAEAALADARRLASELAVEEEEDVLLREGRLLAAGGKWQEACLAFAEAERAARRFNHPAIERLARAHRCRAESRAGAGTPETCSTAAAGHKPHVALLEYLNADLEAEQKPSQEVARALGRAGGMALALGDVALARAAFERQGEVLGIVGENAEADAALARAAAALEALGSGLPEDLKDAFYAHPRNAKLRALTVKPT